VFALSNPGPDVDAVAAGRHARLLANGRSDFPNQISNVLAAIAALVADEVAAGHVIPGPFDERVAPAITAAVRPGPRGRRCPSLTGVAGSGTRSLAGALPRACRARCVA
jgi:malic enzyme